LYSSSKRLALLEPDHIYAVQQKTQQPFDIVA